jgi:CBS domain-containing protein
VNLPKTFASRYVEVDGRPIHFVTSTVPVDPHPPLVLVHGVGLSHRYLMPYTVRLAEHFRVFVPDQPGFGLSYKPQRVLSLPELADWFPDWMDAIGMELAASMGNSKARAAVRPTPLDAPVTTATQSRSFLRIDFLPRSMGPDEENRLGRVRANLWRFSQANPHQQEMAGYRTYLMATGVPCSFSRTEAVSSTSFGSFQYELHCSGCAGPARYRPCLVASEQATAWFVEAVARGVALRGGCSRDGLSREEQETIMQVKEVMTRGAECTRPSASLQEAARKMRDLDVGLLPVCGDNDRLVGMITDRDITVRAVAEGEDPKTTCVQDVMTPDIAYCFEDQDVTEATELMKKNQIRRLVVLNRDKRLVGIVSLGDLAIKTGDAGLSGEALAQVSEPAQVMR